MGICFLFGLISNLCQAVLFNKHNTFIRFLNSYMPHQTWHKSNQFSLKPDSTVCDALAQSHHHQNREKSLHTLYDSIKKKTVNQWLFPHWWTGRHRTVEWVIKLVFLYQEWLLTEVMKQRVTSKSHYIKFWYISDFYRKSHPGVWKHLTPWNFDIVN